MSEYITKQETIKTQSYLRTKELSYEDYCITSQETDDLVIEIIPRVFRNPFLISLWACFESALVNIASYVEHRGDYAKNYSDTLKKIKKIGNERESFDNKLKKYYKEELKLLTEGYPWRKINMLYILRNNIAHSNGNINAIRYKNDKEMINKWIIADFGISKSGDIIMFSKEFINDIFFVVKDALIAMLKQIE